VTDERPILTTDEQPYVQVLRSEAGLYHLAVNDERACELRRVPGRDATPTVAEVGSVPPDVGADALCPYCFELGARGS
jgi:hypothetical protein